MNKHNHPANLPTPETLPAQEMGGEGIETAAAPAAAAAISSSAPVPDNPSALSNRDFLERLLRLGMMRKQQQDTKRLTQQEYLRRLQFNSILAQAKELKKLYPEFDLHEELKNPLFARLLAPGIGLDRGGAAQIFGFEPRRSQATCKPEGLQPFRPSMKPSTIRPSNRQPFAKAGSCWARPSSPGAAIPLKMPLTVTS